MNEKVDFAGEILETTYTAFDKDITLPQPFYYETRMILACDVSPIPDAYAPFWYHPDHFGSSSYITNLTGEINQHMEYLPFGELLVEEHLNSYNSPFKFNAKEFDAETGNYYYGARYYNPKWSIFLSIDRFKEKYPSFSPYNYAAQNPLRYLEINGDSLKVANNEITKEYLLSSVNSRNREFVNFDSDGNVSVDFGNMSEKKARRRLNNDEGLSVINDMVNATDSEGNAEHYYFEVSNRREGILDGEMFSLTLSAKSGDEVTDFSWFDNFSTTDRGDGRPTVTPANGYDGAVYISPGKVFDYSPFTKKEERVNMGSIIRHELRENYLRTHDKKSYPEAHKKAGGQKSFTRFIFD